MDLRKHGSRFRKGINDVARELQRATYRVNHNELVSLCARFAPSESCKFLYYIYFHCIVCTQYGT